MAEVPWIDGAFAGTAFQTVERTTAFTMKKYDRVKFIKIKLPTLPIMISSTESPQWVLCSSQEKRSRLKVNSRKSDDLIMLRQRDSTHLTHIVSQGSLLVHFGRRWWLAVAGGRWTVVAKSVDAGWTFRRWRVLTLKGCLTNSSQVNHHTTGVHSPAQENNN